MTPYFGSPLFKPTLSALGLATLLLVSGCSEPSTEAKTTPTIRPALTEVVANDYASSLTFNGVVRAAERADLGFRINGRVEHIEVQEGDKVTKGQLLARLDSRDASSALKTAQVEFANTQQEFIRANSIYERTQAISRSELDKISTQLDVARNRVEEARRQLEYTFLHAPFDGTVTDKLVDNFTQVQANQVMVTLQDLSHLEVVIEVPNSVMMSEVRKETAFAEFSSIPNQRFDLLLKTYSAQASTESNTFSVVLGLADTKGFRVLPGMSAKVLPEMGDADHQPRLITLPISAIVPDNLGKQFVWVVDSENKASKRYVDLGSTYNERIEISNHLQLGESVIVAGVSSIRDGMDVRPYTDSTGAN